MADRNVDVLILGGSGAPPAHCASQLGPGVSIGGIDIGQVHADKAGVVSEVYAGLVKSRGIRVLEGTGTVVGPRTVEVGDERHDEPTRHG
jgi:dihydrolipoamide dehydrogenase